MNAIQTASQKTRSIASRLVHYGTHKEERGRPQVYWPLLVLVAVGILLRVYSTTVYSTVVTDYFTGDAGRFIRAGYPGLFYDEWQPAGYPSFLAAIRSITRDLNVTVAIQHLLGVTTALVLFATARRAGLDRNLALMPAAFVLLSGDHLFLEQTLLSENLWIPLLALALYAAVRAAQRQENVAEWIAISSGLLALSAVTRNVSLVLPVVLAGWAVLFVAETRRGRLRAVVAAAVPPVVIVSAYVALAGSLGPYTGMGEMSGWALYTRVGQFADCTKFVPPRGTAGLCESRPPGQRPGPYYYYFDAASPARGVFPRLDPTDGDVAGRFAKAAILAQPIDYLRTVTKDFVRFFDSAAGFDRALSGSGPEAMSFRQLSPDPQNSASFVERVKSKYTSVDGMPEAGTSALETYQRTFRLNGLLLFALVVLTAVGCFRCRGQQRSVAIFAGVSAVVLLLIPPAVSAFEARYAIPPAMLLSLSAAIGAASLGGSVKNGRRAPG